MQRPLRYGAHCVTAPAAFQRLLRYGARWITAPAALRRRDAAGALFASTFVQLLKALLRDVLRCGAIEEVSIDDFLSSQQERQSRGIASRWDPNSTSVQHSIQKGIRRNIRFIIIINCALDVVVILVKTP